MILNKEMNLLVFFAFMFLVGFSRADSVKEFDVFSKKTASELTANSLLIDYTYRLTEKLKAKQKELESGGGGIDESKVARESVGVFMLAASKIRVDMDPDFDPNIRALASLTPPGGHYPSGISPSDVADPVERSSYEAAIKKNSGRAASYDIQSRLIYKYNMVLSQNQWNSPLWVR